MDLSTQAGQEILADIERNTSSVRGWRNLMLLCFDQKDIDTFKTLQVICEGFDKLFEQKKLEAKREFEAAVKVIRESKLKVGQRQLPNPIVTTIPLTDVQRLTFTKLAHNPNTTSLLEKVAIYYLDDWGLPEIAQKHLERALNFQPEDKQVMDTLTKAVEALARNLPNMPMATTEAPPSAERTRISFNDTMRLKMPTILRKASGPLPAERSQTLLAHHIEHIRDKNVRHDGDKAFKTANLGSLHQQLRTLQSKIDMIEQRTHTGSDSKQIAAPSTGKGMKPVSISPLAKKSSALPEPKTPADLLTRSLTYIHEGDLDAASADCRRALEINPDQPLVWHTWATIGLGYFEKRQMDQAIESFNEALRLEPNAVESWFNMGVAYAEKGDTEGALRCYLRALFLSPENSKVRCNLGAVYFQNSQFSHAEQCFRKAIEINPDYARAWDNLGATLSARGDLVEAEAACRKAIEIKPDYAEAWFKLGTILFQQDRAQEAREAFEQSMSFRQDFPATYVYLAMLDARDGLFDPALTACKKFTFLGGVSGLDWMAWQEVALAGLQQNRLDESLSAARHATELAPGEPEPWFTLGVVLHHAGQLEEAETAYSRGAELRPDLAPVWYNLGLVRFELKKTALAAEAFQRVIQIDPKSALGWYHSGRTNQVFGKTEEALADYRNAVELDAKLVDAWQNLGALLEELGRHDEAEEAKQKALAALQTSTEK